MPVHSRLAEAVGQLPERVAGVGGRVRGRVTGAVRRRVLTVRERTARKEEAAAPPGHVSGAALADPRVARLAFGGGYLVHPVGAPHSPPSPGWSNETVAGHVYHLRTPLTSSPTRDGGRVVLLGHPVDVDTGTTDAQVITNRLADLADSAGEGSAGVGSSRVDSSAAGPTADPVGAVVQAAAYLGGRWTLLVHHAGGRQVTVVPDALASQPVWWAPAGDLIGSHEALVPQGALLPVNSQLEVSGSGVTVSALDLGPADDRGPTRAPGRAPGAPLEDQRRRLQGASADQEAFAEFRERLREHTRLLTQGERPGVGLTAGPASRAVLAAYLPHRQADDFAFTHFATESAREGKEAATDLFRASALAQRVGLPHRVVRTVDPPEGSVFEAAFRATWPDGTSVATAFARHHLPPDTLELHSAGAELVAAADPDDGATPGDGTAPGELAIARAGAAWVGVPASVRDGDLSHRVGLPFNDRRLLELLTRQPPGESFIGRLAQELPDEE